MTNDVTEAMLRAGNDRMNEINSASGYPRYYVLREIYLAMQAARPPSPASQPSDVERVARDIEGAMICLAKRAEEIGTHPPTWGELALEAAIAALATQPTQSKGE